MSCPPSIGDISKAIEAAMKALGFTGQYDVRRGSSRSTGYVGKPSEDDVRVVVTVEPMGPLDAKS